jgi:iron complex outermembrane recepter protein
MRIGMRTAIFLTTTASALVALPAHAQTSESQAATATTDGEEGDIIVNARRRDEAITAVPMSVTALTAADQDNLVLTTVGDYLNQTPGALLVSGGPDYLNDISIRGQGGGRNGFSESATGIYRNGIYVAGGGFGGRAYNRIDFFDNERFEVFRGPQGALYGRNAIGGAVNLVSTRPQDSWGAMGSVEYVDVDAFNFEGIINAPLSDNGTALRIGGFYSDQNGGDILDVNTRQNLDTATYQGARASFRGVIAPGWETRVSFEYAESASAGFSALGQRLGTGLPAGRRFDPGPYLRNASRVGRVNIDERSLFVELDGDLGFANLSAVFATKNRDGRRFNEDLDHFLGLEGLAGVDLTVAQSEEFDRVGGEIRLSSPGSGPLQWLVGVDVQNSTSDVVTANGGTVPTTSSAALRAQAVRRDTSSEELTSWSVFGSLDYQITDRLTASAEFRYQRDSKDFQFQRVDLTTGPIQIANPTWEAALPVASLRYEVSENLNLYARFATGFRPGGFNLGSANLALLTYNPERVSAFEVGAKGRIPGLRLRFDVAGYYTDTRNLQVVTAASTTDTTFILQNVPGAEQWGAEAQIFGIVRLGPGNFRYSAGIATQDGRFDPGSVIITAGRTVDLSGARVNRARDITLNLSGTYTVPLAGDWTLAATGSLRHEAGGFENATGGTTDVSGRILEGFTTVDARLTVRNGNFQLSAFGRNITDETHILQNINGNNYWNQRARYGIELKLRFGSEE